MDASGAAGTFRSLMRTIVVSLSTLVFSPSTTRMGIEPMTYGLKDHPSTRHAGEPQRTLTHAKPSHARGARLRTLFGLVGFVSTLTGCDVQASVQSRPAKTTWVDLDGIWRIDDTARGVSCYLPKIVGQSAVLSCVRTAPVVRVPR